MGGSARRAAQGALATALLVALAPAHAAPVAARDKTDVIVLKNGDRYTGRIISAQYGILQLSSNHAGGISIEWPAIASISSKYMFRVEQVGGQHYEGLIATRTEDSELIVHTASGDVEVAMDKVSQILPYDSSFWQRVYGSLSLGYSYAKISGVAQTTFQFDARYSGADIEATLDATAMATQDSTGTSTNQDDIAATVFFPKPNRNFWGYISDLQRNRSLGIDGRAVVGSVLGRRLIENTTTLVAGFAGLVYTEEWPANQNYSRSSVEGALGAQWRVFQFSYPKVSLDSSVIVYPSITESPRYRVQANISLSAKITSRFAIKLSGYANYDSRPPETVATGTDYGVTTSLAYQFGSIVQ